jgi:hypothetical protein
VKDRSCAGTLTLLFPVFLIVHQRAKLTRCQRSGELDDPCELLQPFRASVRRPGMMGDVRANQNAILWDTPR